MTNAGGGGSSAFKVANSTAHTGYDGRRRVGRGQELYRSSLHSLGKHGKLLLAPATEFCHR